MEIPPAAPGRGPLSAEDVARLEAHIQSRLCGSVHDFRLVSRAGALILRGHSHTYHAREAACHAVVEATGLPVAGNEIEIF
jgi:hypothetical protein